jgi:hypothetical protein
MNSLKGTFSRPKSSERTEDFASGQAWPPPLFLDDMPQCARCSDENGIDDNWILFKIKGGRWLFQQL